MTIRINVTQERLERMVTVGELITLQSGNLQATVNVMACFILDDNGAYLSREDGAEKLLGLTIAELREASQNFNNKISEAAVPPPNVSDSDAQYLQDNLPRQAG